MMRVSPAERARCLDIGRLQDGRPPGDFGLDEGREPRRRAIGLHWYRSAEIGQTFLDAGVVQGLVQRACELAHDLLRRAPWRENSGPDAHLVIDTRSRGVSRCMSRPPLASL